jgi:5-formyltetrahydrofolate cyclo-ligase
MVEIKDIIHFSGNKLPLRNAFNQRVITLFVPKSSNYPGLGFFIWNPVDEVLMAFQVTVKNPFKTHPKIDRASYNCILWLDFCFDGLDKKPMDILFRKAV